MADITNSIDKLNFTIIEIGDKINKLSFLSIPIITFVEYKRGNYGVGEFPFLTNRQIAKKLLMFGGNIAGQKLSQINIVGDLGINDLTGMETTLDEETAHFIVYGKPMMFVGGKLIDNEITNPECVRTSKDNDLDPRIKTLAEDSVILNDIKQIKKEVKDSVASFRMKSGEIIQASKELIPQISISLIALASSVVILPFGSGLPAAVSSVRNLLASITALQTRMSQFLTLLYPLRYLSILLNTDTRYGEKNYYDLVVNEINKIFSLIEAPLIAINTTLNLVTSVMNSIPKIPGQDPDTPAEGVEADLKATSEHINRGEEVTLEVNATKGSWEYNYFWSSIPSGFIANTKKVTIRPYDTTKYYVRVSDKKDPSNKIIKNIRIFVS